jgi:hypothetical protein
MGNPLAGQLGNGRCVYAERCRPCTYVAEAAGHRPDVDASINQLRRGVVPQGDSTSRAVSESHQHGWTLMFPGRPRRQQR